MDLRLTAKQQGWCEQVRAFLSENVTPALREELWTIGSDERGPEFTEFRRKVGQRGWFGINWPVEYGGLGLDAIDQQIMIDEFELHGVPAFDLTQMSVAPAIMRYGTAENKEDWLPGIAAGEITCALGYSEANAGTDLAGLQTRAVLDGDQWVINGSKLWNSRAHRCTHEWLCVRTDPAAPRHKGISIIMVPMDAAGVELSPLIAWSDVRTNQAHFTDVRVPRRNLIGELNQGWTYITGALDFERGAISSAARLRIVLDELVLFCTTQVLDGHRPVEEPGVALRLAELDADIEVVRLLNLETASLVAAGELPGITVTEAKILQSELRQKLADWGLQILGLYGALDWRDDLAPLRGRLERLYREAPMVRFGGGTNEVLRDVIAQRGHGLPSYGRSSPRPGASRPT